MRSAFPTSCDPAVAADFARAVAPLHSFEFADARRGFEEVGWRAPGCAMARWGIAMPHYHLRRGDDESARAVHEGVVSRTNPSSGNSVVTFNAGAEVERLARELSGSPSVWTQNTSEVLRLQATASIARAPVRRIAPWAPRIRRRARGRDRKEQLEPWPQPR